jgi:two-component system, NarL family, nitrate/nitrite response regulator NarL
MQVLTKKQREILSLIFNEYSNRQIADTLQISIRTVETHRKNIYRKTGTSGIVGLIKYALHHKMLE